MPVLIYASGQREREREREKDRQTDTLIAILRTPRWDEATKMTTAYCYELKYEERVFFGSRPSRSTIRTSTRKFPALRVVFIGAACIGRNQTGNARS